MRNIAVGEHQGKRPLERPRGGPRDDIRISFEKQIGKALVGFY
jgi:hypothetical protein